jgi:hypothetical protein
MGAFLFKCPTTGHNVQAFRVEDQDSDNESSYHSMECLACGQVHFVNPVTRKVLGLPED